MSSVAAAIIVVGATGAAAQTAGAGGQVAAAAPGGTIVSTGVSTDVSTGARANFVISRTIGLGRLDISSLTGGLVRDGDAPRGSTTSDGEATATESSDAGDTTEVEATFEDIEQATTTETQTFEATVAVIGPDPVSSPSDDSPTAGNNGVGGGVGGGRENNRGIGKTGNRGGKK